MSDLKALPEEDLIDDRDHYTKEDIDKIPVYYCKKCLSLLINRATRMVPDSCAKCFGTNIEVTSIQNWEKLYEARYGKEIN